MRPQGAATPEAWAFARMEEVWASYEPLSPRGKDAKEAREVHPDLSAIEAALDDTEAFQAWQAASGADPARRDALAWSLGRLPRLPGPPEPGRPLAVVDLFLVKKFLANHRAVAQALQGPAGLHFGLVPGFDRLYGLLSLGGSDGETFHLAEALDGAAGPTAPGTRLPELRRAIRETDERLEALRAEARRQVESSLGESFAGRDFLVLPYLLAKALDAATGLVSLEAFDDETCILRLRSSAEEVDLLARRQALVTAEAAREGEILASLSEEVCADYEGLLAAEASLARLDLARGRARLMSSGTWTRPTFASGGRGLSLREGRFLPCREECARLGLGYTPLSLDLDEGGAVIFGSNMGGKTVALQTFLFFQVLAQAGFHVPAAAYTSRVYPFLHVIGDLPGLPARDQAGLSGFGREVTSLMAAYRAAGPGAFLVLDEFARTTSSLEAEAILSAVLAGLAGLDRVTFLASTHFHGVDRLPGLRYLRVRGLDREGAAAALAASAPDRPADLRVINGLMSYGLVDEDRAAGGGSDAIAIAALLGLDAAMVEAATNHYRQRTITARDEPQGAQGRGTEKP